MSIRVIACFIIAGVGIYAVLQLFIPTPVAIFAGLVPIALALEN